MEKLKVRKLIDLELKVVNNLEKKALADKRKLKPYIEKVLIEHSNKKDD